MVTIKIILEKRKPKKNGTYPIYFQICYNRKTRTRSTNIAVAEIYWDDTKKEIKKAHTDCKLLNQKLKKMFADIQSELLLADKEKVSQYFNTFKQIAEKQLPVEKEILTLYQFAGKLIQDLKSLNKFGNAWVYEATINALKGFHPEDDIQFEHIDYEFLDAYQRHLNTRNIKPNSVYLYIRTIRIFYNKAIKLKLVDKGSYPFDDFKLKPEKTRKRAINSALSATHPANDNARPHSLIVLRDIQLRYAPSHCLGLATNTKPTQAVCHPHCGRISALFVEAPKYFIRWFHHIL